MKFLTICLVILMTVSFAGMAEVRPNPKKIFDQLIKDSRWAADLFEGWEKDQIETEQLRWFMRKYGVRAGKIYRVIVNSGRASDFKGLIKALSAYRVALLKIELSLGEENAREKLERFHLVLRGSVIRFIGLRMLYQLS